MRSGKHLLTLPRGKHLFGTVKVGEKGQIVIPKEARDLFGISPGDTLLILGDEENGIFISRPEVISDAANRVFASIDRTDRTDGTDSTKSPEKAEKSEQIEQTKQKEGTDQ